MARITRSKKLQTLEDQTFSPETQKKSTIMQGTCTQLYTKEIDTPLEGDKALVVGLKKSGTALEMISGNVTANTYRKCKLVVTSIDESGNDFSNHCSSMKQVNKLVKNKDIDVNIKRPKNTKDASSKSTPVGSNKDDYDSSYLGEEQVVNLDELVKKPYKKTMDDTRISGEFLISENNTMNENNPSSVKLDDGEDSFIAQIISRSPAKPISRIEDPLDELGQPEQAFEELDEVARVENMFKHKPHPKPRVPATSKMRPVFKNKDVSIISPKTSIISPAKILSPSKLEKNCLSKATIHNDLTHPVQNVELHRKIQPSNTAIDSNKFHYRPTQGYSKKVSINPLDDIVNTRIRKIHSTSVVHQVPTIGPPKVKESKSHSNLKAVNSPDDVFTRLSTGTYKSRSSSQKTNEKVTQAARPRKSCHKPHLLSHKVINSNSNSSDLSREKDTSTNIRRPLKTQNSRECLYKTKSNLASPPNLKPPLAGPLKKTSESNCTSNLRRNSESRPVDETRRFEAAPEKVIEKVLQERKNAALLARAEAAEKGRRAVMEWAESQKTKR